MATYLFYLVATLALLFTGMVVLLRNPITAALSLVASFFCVSILFILLHAPFLGVIQVLVYAGAIMVLFLYVVMLLDLRSEQSSFTVLEKGVRWLALALVPVLLLSLIPALNLSDDTLLPPSDSFGSIASVGRSLLGPYALAFEVVSLILLAAMIGVVVLVPRKKKGDV